MIQDAHLDTWIWLPRFLAENPGFNLANWYECRLSDLLEFFVLPDPLTKCSGPKPDDDSGGGSSVATNGSRMKTPHTYAPSKTSVQNEIDILLERIMNLIPNGVQVPRGTYPTIQRNTAIVKDSIHKVPWPVVVTIKIDGHPTCTLLDSGSLGDFLSSMLADQLNVKCVKVNTPLALQIAVQGS